MYSAQLPLCQRCHLCISKTVYFRYCTTVCTTPRTIQVNCGSWIPWLVSRIRCLADKLRGGREDLLCSERSTNRYDDDTVTAKVLGWHCWSFAVVILAARALPQQTNRRRMAQKRGTRRKYSQFSVAQRYGAALCALNLWKSARCRLCLVYLF